MANVCNRVSMQGMYMKEPFHGYVKAIIINVGGEDGHRYERKHSCSPLYIPFSSQRRQYTLHHDQAVLAEDTAPGSINILKHRWELHPLAIPRYERERMGVVFERIEGSLEALVQQAVSLARKSEKSRRRFLSIFPVPLRMRFNEREVYGTPGSGLHFSVYEWELPHSGKALAVPSEGKPMKIPVRFFNQ